jgi:hypothetical protein
VLLVLAIGFFGGIITTRLAIPIQKQMDYGDPSNIPALVHQLITIDLYWRMIPGLISMVALALMVYQLSGVTKQQTNNEQTLKEPGARPGPQ